MVYLKNKKLRGDGFPPLILPAVPSHPSALARCLLKRHNQTYKQSIVLSHREQNVLGVYAMWSCGPFRSVPAKI
jgi:hypothetical protein